MAGGALPAAPLSTCAAVGSIGGPDVGADAVAANLVPRAWPVARTAMLAVTRGVDTTHIVAAAQIGRTTVITQPATVDEAPPAATTHYDSSTGCRSIINQI